MKFLAKLGPQQNFIKNAYADFSKRCFSPSQDYRTAKAEFKNLGDMFLRERQIEEFCEKTLDLSKQLNENGKSGLGALFINELSKLCVNLRHPNAEEYLRLALETNRKKKDGFHELARLTDLEYLYRNTNNRRGLFNVLRQKKSCCKNIIANYDEHLKNYESINRAPTSKSGVKTQLAFTYSDIAGMIERRSPEDAINLYEKSKNIYIELGQQRETDYLKERIRRITARLNKSQE